MKTVSRDFLVGTRFHQRILVRENSQILVREISAGCAREKLRGAGAVLDDIKPPICYKRGALHVVLLLIGKGLVCVIEPKVVSLCVVESIRRAGRVGTS